MSNIDRRLSQWADLPIIPEGTVYPILDRSGERIADPGGTEGQPTFGAEVERALAEGLPLIRAAYEVFEREPLDPYPEILFDEELVDPPDEELVDPPDGLDDRPRYKARVCALFGLESPYRIIKAGVMGWQREHVVAYMSGRRGNAMC